MPTVSVISTALNQGNWVRETIPRIRESLGDVPHEIIVVDDQSADGCCHGLDKDVLVLRTETRFGVSASRRLGTKNASGEVYLFTDPHCHYPGRALADLVQCAMDKQAICLPKTTSLPKVSKARYGGQLTRSDRGLKVSYCMRRPAPWPALLGAIYAIQKPLYEHLGGWPELPGVWGYSEQALTLMAWFSGVPIYVDTRHTCNHQHYHPNDRFAYRVPLAHQANNGHWIHAAFFPKTYESYWLPTLKKRFRDRSDYWSCLDKRGWPSKLEGRRTIEGFRKEIADRAVRTEEDFYELILGEPMPRPEISAITDEAYIRQQRRRSKPGGDYSSVERRQARALDWFISQVPGCIKGLKVLDLGARDGYLVERLQNLGVYKAEGVELVPDTAEYARTVLKRNVITGDMRRLPYKDGQWHRVLCLHTLEHVPDPKAAITEMLRVLMPGGWFLIVVPIDKEGPERRFSHNSYFPDEKALIDIVTNGHPVQGIKTEVKALKPKKQEILLVGQKERPTTASQTRRKR